MRRVLLIVAIALLIGFASCLDPGDDHTDDDADLPADDDSPDRDTDTDDATTDDDTPTDPDDESSDNLDPPDETNGDNATSPTTEIEIIETNDPIEGTPLELTAEIANTDVVETTHTITLDAGDLGTVDEDITLDGGENTTQTLTLETNEGDASEYTVTIQSDDESDSTDVTVLEPAVFEIEHAETNQPIEGDELSITADITNTGGSEATQTVDVDAGDLGTDSTSLTLPADEKTTETFTVETSDGDASEYTVTIETDNESTTADVTVLEPAVFETEIVETNDPIEGDPLELTAEITNTGDIETTQTITLDAGGLGTAEEEVTLAGDTATTETFTVQTNGGDADEYTVTVASDDHVDTEEITVVEPPLADLEFHHIDVGQADATLIITPEDETILIDTGDWRQDGSEVLAYLDEYNIDRLDHLVATHAHADHIGGHAAIIEEFEANRDGIGNIYDSGVPHDTQTYENYLDAVDQYDHELLLVEEGDTLPLDTESVTATVLNPPAGDSGTDLHYNSVTLLIEFGDVQYLTTGDAERGAESRMLTEWAADLSADIYHAGHHGSSTSSTESFMQAVDPDISIISSAFDSQFGHPHDEVLDRFDTMGIETYWTGVHEDIFITTDGDNIEVSPTVDESTDPATLQELKDGDTVNAITSPGGHSLPTSAFGAGSTPATG